jgi:hypothetical protein
MGHSITLGHHHGYLLGSSDAPRMHPSSHPSPLESRHGSWLLLCVQLVFVARRLPALLSSTSSRAALSALPLPVLLELLGHEELLVDSVGHLVCTPHCM